MNGELQVWELIREASLLVQFVMALLVFASIASWMVIFRKRQMLSRAESRSRKFEEKFWSGADLNKLYDSVAGSLSLRSVSWQVGAIVGPLAVGLMFDYVSYLGGFWLAAGLMVVAGAVFLFLFESEAAPEQQAVCASGD